VGDLAVIDLGDHHLPDTLGAEEVVAAGHEEELGAELVSGADIADVLLLVELKAVGFLGHGEVGLGLSHGVQFNILEHHSLLHGVTGEYSLVDAHFNQFVLQENCHFV
jgi:hypothetical protein